jgi:hypothetical protein
MAEYGVGGGIVYGLEGTIELEECDTEAKILGRPPPDFALLEKLLTTPTYDCSPLGAHPRRRRRGALCPSGGRVLFRSRLDQPLSWTPRATALSNS